MQAKVTLPGAGRLKMYTRYDVASRRNARRDGDHYEQADAKAADGCGQDNSERFRERAALTCRTKWSRLTRQGRCPKQDHRSRPRIAVHCGRVTLNFTCASCYRGPADLAVKGASGSRSRSFERASAGRSRRGRDFGIQLPCPATRMALYTCRGAAESPCKFRLFFSSPCQMSVQSR